MSDRWGPRILAAVFFLIGGGLAADGYRSARLGLAAGTWPTTEGVVTARTGGQGRSRFHFDYEMAGESHRGHRAGFVMPPLYRPQLEYADGDTVTVRYDPDRPSRAVLVAGVSWWGLAFGFSAPVLLVAVGLWVIVASRPD